MAVDYFRAVLVSAGVLPVRDEYLARLERWVERKTAALDDLDHRHLITAFARWDRIARIRRRARGKPITAATADIVQTQIFKAITFLTWLKEHDETLSTCRQPVIDLWLTSENHQGPYTARPFVTWAVRGKFASGINIPARPRRMFQRPLDADERWSIARQLLNDDSLETKDRVAGLMVLLYGQNLARVCRLTTAHITHDDQGVALQLNKTPLRLPPPLDRLVLQLVDIAHSNEHRVMSNEQNAPWLFPTQRPGKPLTSRQLANRLRNIGLPSEAGRCAASSTCALRCPRASSSDSSVSVPSPPSGGPREPSGLPTLPRWPADHDPIPRTPESEPTDTRRQGREGWLRRALHRRALRGGGRHRPHGGLRTWHRPLSNSIFSPPTARLDCARSYVVNVAGGRWISRTTAVPATDDALSCCCP